MKKLSGQPSKSVEDYRDGPVGNFIKKRQADGQKAADENTLAQKSEPGSLGEQAGNNSIDAHSGDMSFNDRYAGKQDDGIDADDAAPAGSGGVGSNVAGIPEQPGQVSNSLDMNGALQTVDQILQHSYQKAGLGGQQQPQGIPQQSQGIQGAIPDQEQQSDQPDATPQAFEEGGSVEPEQGAIPEQPGQQAQQQPQQPGQGGPQAGGQNKFIASMLQGMGAMPIQQAQQLEHKTGESDPNLAKLAAIHQLAQTQGPDAAAAYLASMRKQFDFNRTNAATKIASGNLNQATEAATHAMTNILDGTATHFSPTPDGKGVKVSVRKLGRSNG